MSTTSQSENYWKVQVTSEAKRDFDNLDLATRTLIRERLRKEVRNELPNSHPLESKPGWYSICIKKLRVVYIPSHDGTIHIMLITAVGWHNDVYRAVDRRFAKYGKGRGQ